MQVSEDMLDEMCTFLQIDKEMARQRSPSPRHGPTTHGVSALRRLLDPTDRVG
jgi:hypothetical protein